MSCRVHTWQVHLVIHAAPCMCETLGCLHGRPGAALWWCCQHACLHAHVYMCMHALFGARTVCPAQPVGACCVANQCKPLVHVGLLAHGRLRAGTCLVVDWYGCAVLCWQAGVAAAACFPPFLGGSLWWCAGHSACIYLSGPVSAHPHCHPPSPLALWRLQGAVCKVLGVGSMCVCVLFASAPA